MQRQLQGSAKFSHRKKKKQIKAFEEKEGIMSAQRQRKSYKKMMHQGGVRYDTENMENLTIFGIFAKFGKDCYHWNAAY